MNRLWQLVYLCGTSWQTRDAAPLPSPPGCSYHPGSGRQKRFTVQTVTWSIFFFNPNIIAFCSRSSTPGSLLSAQQDSRSQGSGQRWVRSVQAVRWLCMISLHLHPKTHSDAHTHRTHMVTLQERAVHCEAACWSHMEMHARPSGSSQRFCLLQINAHPSFHTKEEQQRSSSKILSPQACTGALRGPASNPLSCKIQQQCFHLMQCC